MPFGLPVVPEVYRMYSGCSESTLSGGSSAGGALASSSCHQWSRPAFSSTFLTDSPTRRSTSTFSTVGVPSTALATLSYSGTTLPRRKPPSAVTIALAPQSLTRSRIASGAKPPKITVCGAPSRAQASIAIAASGTIGM
jgi:hypothetical protein